MNIQAFVENLIRHIFILWFLILVTYYVKYRHSKQKKLY